MFINGITDYDRSGNEVKTGPVSYTHLNLCRSQRGRPFFRYPSPLVIHHLQPRPHAPRPATPTQAAGRSHDAHAARAANRRCV